MPTSATPPWFELKLGGSALTADELPHLNRVEMTEAVSQLDSITIEFSIPMTSARYDIISTLKAISGGDYSFKCGSNGKESKEYTGVIMTVSHSLSRDSMLKITLTGVDELVKLKSARLPQAEGWESLETALDKMATDAGFKGIELIDFQATELPIFQEGTEDLKFIADFARVNGFAVRVSDTKLKFFKVGTDHADGPQTIAWNEDVVSMNITTDISEVYGKAQAVTYDTKKVEDVSVETDKASLKTISGGKTGAEYASAAFPNRLILLANKVDAVSSSLTQEAEGKLQESNMKFLKGTIAVYGRPDLYPGSNIEITDGYWPFKGVFYVEQVKHTIAPGAGFKTTITIASDSLPPEPS